MIDEQRIARLIELARYVWPQHHDLVLHVMPKFRSAAIRMDHDGEPLLLIEDHPRALDALEAALCVLAGETLEWAEKLATEWIVRASEWQEEEDDEFVSNANAILLQECARELRERAEEETTKPARDSGGRHG